MAKTKGKNKEKKEKDPAKKEKDAVKKARSQSAKEKASKTKDGISVKKKKSRRNKTAPPDVEALLPDEEEDEEEEEELPPPPPSAVSFKPEEVKREFSDGSLSDTTIPKINLGMLNPCGSKTDESAIGVGDELLNAFGMPMTCNMENVKLTESVKISCVKSDDQEYATTDYVSGTTTSFTPPNLHPLKGQVTFQCPSRHREYTDYLKNSGFLKLFGTCILNVYRMQIWPLPEKLLEEMLNAMGHPCPERVEYNELSKLKESLQEKIESLTKERYELLTALDEFEDSATRYELLDQDVVLPPAPEPSFFKFNAMNQFFQNMVLVSDTRDNQSTDIEVTARFKKGPEYFMLPIPFHDKRLLR